MEKIEKIFKKYRYESGTLDLAIEDQLPMIREIEQELDKAREEGYREGWGDCERFHLLLEQAEEDILSAEEITELDLLKEKLSKIQKE